MIVKQIIEGEVNRLLNHNEELMKVRLAICETCDFFDAKNQKCNNCGCSIARAGRVPDKHCPIKKW